MSGLEQVLAMMRAGAVLYEVGSAYYLTSLGGPGKHLWVEDWLVSLLFNTGELKVAPWSEDGRHWTWTGRL